MRFSTVASLAISALPFASRSLAAPIRPRQLAATDALVLKFANVLEQLETAFYQQALDTFDDQDFIDAGFTVPDAPKQIFASILEHEAAHTTFLADALAGANDAAIDTCVFDFSSVLTDVTTMAAVAQLVEQVGVGAYLGAATLITDKSILGAAASILTIEARHQSALNLLNGQSAVPAAFDQALSPEQVLSLAGPFISGCSFPEFTPTAPVALNSAPVPGQRLDIDTSGLVAEELFCQMLVPGHPIAFVQSIDDCVVPPNLPEGPVFVFITSTDHPVPSNILVQNKEVILAGPAIVFISTVDDALANLVRDSEARDIVDSIDNSPVSPEAPPQPEAPAPEAPAPESPAPEAPAPVDAPQTPVTTPENATIVPGAEERKDVTVVGHTTVPL